MAEAHAVDPSLIPGSPSFALATRFFGSVVVEVRGEVDAFTAPALGALIDELVEAGHTVIVLDLAAVEFMDAAGLRVIAPASARLRPAGGSISIRSPTVMVRRILAITNLLDLLEDGVPAEPVSVTAAPAAAVTLTSTPPVSMLPGTGDVADAALRLVTALASEMVDNADGASVTLRRHGKLATIGASNDQVAQMDDDQYATGEGPCLSATAEGRTFHVESSADETRWPRFISRAVEHGIASILSTPLIVADIPVGALNIYSNSERAFGPDEQEVAALLARQASRALAATGAGQTADDAAERLLHALRSREVIAHAEGAIMMQRGVSATAASADLRRSARRQTMTVRALAASIVVSAAHGDTTGEARR